MSAPDRHTEHKARLAPLRAAMYDFTETGVRAALAGLAAPDALFRLAFPFGDMTGPEAFYDRAYAPLFAAIPDLERRDFIVMAGPTPEGADWVGCGGYYTGTFAAPWMDIPPTGHQMHLRFHEFYRFEDGVMTEFQALWDIPEVM
ncbi:SnoaL-like polyketide cyclase, partial [Cribrihabitans marinus]